MKRTLAVTLLLLTVFIPASAQDARRVAAVNASKHAKSNAARPTRPKVSTAEDESQKSGAYPDEIDLLLGRNALARGVVAARAIKSRIMRGRVEMSESPLPGAFESYEKEPGKRLNVLNAPAGQFLHGTDGEKRWQQSPWGFDTKLLGGEEGAKEGPRGQMWRKLFSSASIRGRAFVDGRETVVLAATPKGERPILMYFDAETSLLLKQEFTPHTPQWENEMKAIYIDRYSVVDGVSVPTLFRQIYTNYTLTFRIYEVKHNVPIDDALFRDPNGK